MLKHIPNILTTIRLFLVPLFALIYFSSMPNAMAISLAIFVIAGITDVLDGYIARRFELISAIGIALDPLADKLMLLTTLTCLYISGYLPFIILAIMYIKEFTMMITGVFMYFQKEKLLFHLTYLENLRLLYFL